MPPKVRELISELERAGFVWRGGRGSHRKFEHPALKDPVVVSGSSGADAKPYQVRAVTRAIRESRS